LRHEIEGLQGWLSEFLETAGVAGDLGAPESERAMECVDL
jgi:hypothetical protein